MDFIVNLGFTLGGVIGGWLITHCYYRRVQKENHKQKIIDKLESLNKDIMFAYKEKNSSKRKDKLQTIAYISIQNQRILFKSAVISDLQDILFKNLNNEEQTIVEMTQVFKKHFVGYFD